MIEWRSVGKIYRGGVEALMEFSLAAESGEVFGLLGANGAGKTTALKIAVDLIRADRGEVTIGGVTSRDPSSRLDTIYLPEEIHFPDALRLKEWYVHQLRIRRRPHTKSIIAAAAERVGLESRLHSPLGRFSKGMKRRAGLMLLAGSKPKLSILDEPTADLDVEGREMVEGLIVEARAEGRTVFLSSHILSEVERVCDRVGIVAAGQLRRIASPADLLPAPFVADLMFSPFPGEPEQIIEGLPMVVSEGGRIRIFVSDRAEADSVIERFEQGGFVPSKSTFRAASLRDAFRALTR